MNSFTFIFLPPRDFFYHINIIQCNNLLVKFFDRFIISQIYYKANDAYNTDVISAKSAAQGMARMRQEFIFYKRAYDDVSQNALWQYMLEYFVKRYEAVAKEKLNTDILDTQLKYSIRLYCYGCVGMTREWLLNDNTTSAETVVQMMYCAMPNDMRNLFFNE
ncbi:MAG: TetR family transcriptional regulator C-terminal domain-containing protein [Clostridia bacterium]|nr:TetR family transcriptional regulator C-terminal domain-containing protein [Clostridia bacterium]